MLFTGQIGHLRTPNWKNMEVLYMMQQRLLKLIPSTQRHDALNSNFHFGDPYFFVVFSNIYFNFHCFLILIMNIDIEIKAFTLLVWIFEC